MLNIIWNTLLYAPILNGLVAFYHLFGNNFGLAIIALTVFIRVLSYPLTKPSLEAAKKQRELKPDLDKLKEKYKNKQKLAEKQMELYKKHGINPVAGCLPQIIQLIVVIALYRTFTNLLAGDVNLGEVNNLLYNFDFLKFAPAAQLNTQFLYLNLAHADPFYVLPVLAAATQFIMSKQMSKSTQRIEKTVKETPDKSDDFLYNMQEQMTYMFPIMTLVIGVTLPSGLVLYWFVSTLIAVVQYQFMNKKA